MTPEEMLARLLYRDGLMLVIDKPAGYAVHLGPRSGLKGGHLGGHLGGESLEDHFDALRFGLPRRPSLAHRLDRDTSGCLVLGRHRKALALLGRLFKNGRIGKTYWAVVEGGPVDDEGTIDMPLGKLDETRGWWMKPDANGQPAVTKWKVMGRFSPSSSRASEPGKRGSGPIAADKVGLADPEAMGPRIRGDDTELTWLALEPLTGRTHQLRVHCAERGFPIVGDNIYGTAPRAGGPTLHLHSREVVVPISKNKDAVVVTAPAPAHMRERLRMCGWDDPHPEERSEGARLEG